MTSDRDRSSPDTTADANHASRAWLHDPSLVGERSRDVEAAAVRRRNPIAQSRSSLTSRDYRPVVEGPRLICSWLLGLPPAGRGSGERWEIGEEWEVIQRNVLSAPHLGPLDEAPTYLIVCGRAEVDGPGTTLEVELANEHLAGKPYEVSVTITATEETVFNTPTIELTPDRGVYRGLEARHFPEYVLRARATDGLGSVDAATNVQLWSG